LTTAYPIEFLSGSVYLFMNHIGLPPPDPSIYVSVLNSSTATMLRASITRVAICLGESTTA
jgi:hypothetical protein